MYLEGSEHVSDSWRNIWGMRSGGVLDLWGINYRSRTLATVNLRAEFFTRKKGVIEVVRWVVLTFLAHPIVNVFTASTQYHDPCSVSKPWLLCRHYARGFCTFNGKRVSRGTSSELSVVS